MNYRLNYSICNLHEEPLNYICLKNNCSHDRIICVLCRSQRHPEPHHTVPLKLYLQTKVHKFRCITPTQHSQMISMLDQHKVDFNKELDSIRRKIYDAIQVARKQFQNFYEDKVELLTKCEELMKTDHIQIDDLQSIEMSLAIAANYEESFQSSLIKLTEFKTQITSDLFKLKIDLNSGSYHKWVGHKDIKIDKNVLSSRTNSYKVGYFTKPLSLKPLKMSFNILKSQNNWIGFGVCHKNIVDQNKLAFRYHTIGHGVYAISSNGGSWSHYRPDYNNKIGAFTFSQNDPITVSFDAGISKVIFESQQNLKYSLEIDPKEKGTLHFCVLFYYKGDQLETECTISDITV